MDNHIITDKLINISNSQLDLIFKIYSIDTEKITSRVVPLLKILEGLKDEDRNDNYKTKRNKSIASSEAVEDLKDILKAGIEAYKLKYKVRLFPTDMKVMELHQALNKIDATTFFADVIKQAGDIKTEKSKTGKINNKKEELLLKMKLDLLGK